MGEGNSVPLKKVEGNVSSVPQDLCRWCLENDRPTGEKSVKDGLEQINDRVSKVFNEYLKDIKEDGEFATGYVEGTEVLETFLEDYKRAGGVGFSIRDSWRRSGLTTQPRLREFEPGRGLEDGNGRPSSSNENPKTQSSTDARSKLQTGQKGTGPLESQCRILWQSKNGCLKLPNLGMPFIIQAYERRVCTFTTTRRGKKPPSGTDEDEQAEAEIDTQDPSLEKNQQEVMAPGCSSSNARKRSKNVGKEASSKKKRIRKSVKKDCKAVVELKEIWIFADYKPVYAEDSTEHAKRKAREKIISRLQSEIKSGKVKYLKRYYLRLPYPIVHSGHEIGLNNKMCKVSPFVVTCIQNLVTEGITAIKNVQHHINKLVEIECAKSSKRYIFGLNYDNSYYPDEKTIRNHIYLALKSKAPVKEEPEQGRPPSPRHVRLLSNTASNVRSELKEINNLTQKCQDVQLLTELLQQIETIRKQFQDKLDKTLLLPREPIPIISTQDSHGMVNSLDGLPQDAFVCKNPADDAESLGIDTDLAAAEILQSFTSNSFTQRGGMTDSPDNFDNIPPIPEMYQQLVNMMPQQSQHQLQQHHQPQQQIHIQAIQSQPQQQTQQQIPQIQQIPHSQQQIPHSQQQQQIPHSQQQQQIPHSQQQQQQIPHSQQQQQIPHSQQQQQQIPHSQQQQQQIPHSQQQQQIPHSQQQQQQISHSQQQPTPHSQQISHSQQQQQQIPHSEQQQQQISHSQQLSQTYQQQQLSQNETHYQLMTSFPQLPTDSDQLTATQVLHCSDSDAKSTLATVPKGRTINFPQGSSVTIHIGSRSSDVIANSINTIASSLTLGGRDRIETRLHKK